MIKVSLQVLEMVVPVGGEAGWLGERQRLFSRPHSLEAAENAGKEKTILEVILKFVFVMWFLRALRENMIFIVLFFMPCGCWRVGRLTETNFPSVEENPYD
jgi:hypothetical protein